MTLESSLNKFLLAVRDPKSAVNYLITDRPKYSQYQDGWFPLSELVANMILSEREVPGDKVERLTVLTNEFANVHPQKSLAEFKIDSKQNIMLYRIRDISKLATVDTALALSL